MIDPDTERSILVCTTKAKLEEEEFLRMRRFAEYERAWSGRRVRRPFKYEQRLAEQGDRRGLVVPFDQGKR